MSDTSASSDPGISRRGFLAAVGAWSIAGSSAAGAQGEGGVSSRMVDYHSRDGHGDVSGLLAWPESGGPFPGVIVLHEDRGLDPYIADVTRRLAAHGYLAFAPDGLSSVGGYPGADDTARGVFATLERARLRSDFLEAVEYLRRHPRCTGRVGVTGFSFGGDMCHDLAAETPDLACAIPFYGRPERIEDLAAIRSPLLLHRAGDDTRVGDIWPDYERTLIEGGHVYDAPLYAGTRQGFHNASGQDHHPQAARLAWLRTRAWLAQFLA
ncbi:dienelactone hydrolase family protein [Maricaulis sp. CAU 1757]